MDTTASANTANTAAVTILRGRWVLTGDRAISSGAIAIQGDTILAVDDWETLRAHYPHATVEGSDRDALLPGLINAHHHSNGISNVLQGIDDDFLEPWLFALGAQRSQNTTLKTLLNIAQLLKSGVTTVVDVKTISGAIDTCHTDLKTHLAAYEQAGMRVALTPGSNYDSFLVHGEDAAFLNSLPADLAQRVRAHLPLTEDLTKADHLALISDLVQTYRDHPHISVWFGPPGPQWVGDDLLVEIAAAARLDTHIQTHAVESFYEKLLGPRLYGKSVIAHLQTLGVLSPRFSIAHGVWLTRSDLEILATTGAAVSHNPSSNLRLRAGVAPLNAMLAHGVTVALGMDGTTMGDDEDLFAEMRLAARLHRVPQMGEPAPTWAEIFHLATQGGAALMGQAHAIGKLAPGYRADVVRVNCDRLAWPWVAPEADPLHVVLMRARAADVEAVWVNGKQVLRDGLPTGFDLAAVGAALAEEMTAAGDREMYRAIAADLRPHLLRWYQGWALPALSPYAAFNAQ